MLPVHEDNRNSPGSSVSTDGSASNKVNNMDVTMSNDVQSFLLSPVLNSHLDVAPHLAYQNMHNIYSDQIDDLHTRSIKSKAQENSPLLHTSGFFDDSSGRLISEPYIDSDPYEEVI